MRSEKQIQASRLNGAKSRGPVTAEGRFNSAHPNLRKHMLANSVLAKGESRLLFNEFHQSLIAELQPATPLQRPRKQKSPGDSKKPNKTNGISHATEPKPDPSDPTNPTTHRHP